MFKNQVKISWERREELFGLVKSYIELDKKVGKCARKDIRGWLNDIAANAQRDVDAVIP